MIHLKTPTLHNTLDPRQALTGTIYYFLMDDGFLQQSAAAMNSKRECVECVEEFEVGIALCPLCGSETRIQSQPISQSLRGDENFETLESIIRRIFDESLLVKTLFL